MTPTKPNTTCPVCDLTNENLEGLPCTALAEMERFLATLGPPEPEPAEETALRPRLDIAEVRSQLHKRLSNF